MMTNIYTASCVHESHSLASCFAKSHTFLPCFGSGEEKGADLLLEEFSCAETLP